MKIRSGIVLLLIPAVAAAQGDSTTVMHIPLMGFGGVSYGYVVPGISHADDVRKLLDSVGGLGQKRENNIAFIVGGDTLRASDFYTPPATMNQLYFENDVLVMIVEGIPHNVPPARSEFMARYPNARETRRESDWYEVQTRVRDGIWLIAVFRVRDDRLDSDAYAYTHRRKN